MIGFLMSERMSERENKDGSQVSHLKNQVMDGDVTEMGEDWGKARLVGWERARRQRLETCFGHKSDVQVKMSSGQQRSCWGDIWQLVGVAGFLNRGPS